MSDLKPYWADQLWHEMRAQGRARLAVEAPEWQQPSRAKSAEHKAAIKEGLRKYHERIRAQKGKT